MIDEITRLMRLLEFSDSAFPVGTFSFSNGLETAAFEGIVYDAQTLEQYTRTALRQTIYSDAIAALIAFRAAAGGNYKTILEADRQIILCKMNAEARLMLIRMGKKMAEICTQITDSPWMSRWLEDIRAERTPGTYPVAQAIYFQQNGSTEKDLFVAIEYGAINMILNAALRCVKVSHYETQAILYRLCTEAAENYKIVRELNFEDMQAFAPEMDVIASVIIGGASLAGGLGTSWGTFIGIIFLGIINNIMTLTGVSSDMQYVVQGLLIIGAVLLNSFNNRKKSA